MKQEEEDDETDDDPFFDQNAPQGLDRLQNEIRPIVSGYDLDAFGERALQLRELRFHPSDDVERVFSVARDDDAADGRSFAVEIRPAAVHVVGTYAGRSNVLDENGPGGTVLDHGAVDLRDVLE